MQHLKGLLNYCLLSSWPKPEITILIKLLLKLSMFGCSLKKNRIVLLFILNLTATISYWIQNNNFDDSTAT